MLQELINLTNKAKGTPYETMFQEVYELTVEIEATYGEKFPSKPNKIIYFHERFTSAFVNTYALLMQNVEESFTMVSVSDDSIVFRGNPVTSLSTEDIRASDMSYSEYFGRKLAKDIEISKRYGRSVRMASESERVWELRNKLKTSKEEGKKKFGTNPNKLVEFAVCNVDNSNALTWFCFPNESEPYKLSFYTRNQHFIDEVNRRYFSQREHFLDNQHIVDYHINDEGQVIVKNKQGEYFLILVNYDADKPRKSWEMIEFRPTAFTLNHTATSYERNQTRKYIALMTRRFDATELPKGAVTLDLLWKCYVYDNLRWALHTKIEGDSQPVEWVGTYGNREAWENADYFKSLVFMVYPSATENPTAHQKQWVFDLMRAYSRAIDLLEIKTNYAFSAQSHHHALQTDND